MELLKLLEEVVVLVQDPLDKVLQLLRTMLVVVVVAGMAVDVVITQQEEELDLAILEELQMVQLLLASEKVMV